MYRSQSLHSTAINMTEHLGNAGRGNDTTSSRPAPVGCLTGDGSETNKRSQGVYPCLRKSAESKVALREGRQEGQCGKERWAMSRITPPVRKAKQGVETGSPQGWTWVEKSVWTDRMLAALVNGVKGGKWFSLIDKVCAVSTLKAAWQRVEANRGAAGVELK